MPNFMIVIMIMIGVFTSLVVFISFRREQFSSIGDYPSKCYSCEAALPSRYAWMGQKTKCFSCEQDAIHQACGNTKAGFNAHPLRYYTALPNTSANLGHM